MTTKISVIVNRNQEPVFSMLIYENSKNFSSVNWVLFLSVRSTESLSTSCVSFCLTQ